MLWAWGELPQAAKVAEVSFIHSFIHSSTYPFIHSSIHPVIHPSIHSFIHLSIHSFVHSSIHPFIHSFIHSFTFPVPQLISCLHESILLSVFQSVIPDSYSVELLTKMSNLFCLISHWFLTFSFCLCSPSHSLSPAIFPSSKARAEQPSSVSRVHPCVGEHALQGHSARGRQRAWRKPHKQSPQALHPHGRSHHGGRTRECAIARTQGNGNRDHKARF